MTISSSESILSNFVLPKNTLCYLINEKSNNSFKILQSE
jgi:hypothetical protein